jgi:uncharacterized protein DUF1722
MRRVPLMAIGMLSMACGAWLGLVRLGWNLPLPFPDQLIAHGPLMVCGFLGTLISLERAIALGSRWGYAAPALAQLTTPRRHTNVLQHMAGYFKDRLDAASKRELADTIDDYRCGLVPLIVPLTLLRHQVRTFDVTYLAEQTYLQTHPKELMLRNHV